MAKKKEAPVEVATQSALTPSGYFDILSERAGKAKEEDLKQLYENALKLMQKYKITGQKAGALKLYNFANLCEREISVVRAGYDVYINRQDLDEYIEKVSDKAVLITALEEFERDIPDEVVDKLADCKEKKLFDAYFIVFTDYTGKERKKVEAVKREKDPILLGAIYIGQQISTRLYHIASWEDEYCDLTLDKMVKEFNAAKKYGAKDSMAKSLKESFGSYEDFKRSFEKNKDSIFYEK